MAEVFNPRAALEGGSKNITEASAAFYRIVEVGTREHRKTHPETAISAAGFVAGTLVLRASGAELSGKKMGSPIEAPNIERNCIRMIEFMQGLCAEAGVGRDGGWLDPLPKDHRPNKKMQDLIAEFEPRLLGVAMEFGVDEGMRAGVAAATAVRFIRECRVELPVDIAKALAAQSLVRAAKTVPPTCKPPVKYSRDKPWWKFW